MGLQRAREDLVVFRVGLQSSLEELVGLRVGLQSVCMDLVVFRYCHQIETKDLDMIRTSSKFVPRILAEEQKEVRMEVCQNMIEMTRIDPEWSQNVITGDETWVYQYDPEYFLLALLQR
ncbi:hypothetical protein LAZ67_13003074 [Cordylochernes scorpioides]|uniref:Uncharacterized protein n=1 Tax=Cordylochernes scorpioides TaxID=51811 RepID=A0ABY6L904_9ARAC|nr:hypothetical protein LAZ67_13003074 [Cordylochernes scorpioides]